MEKNLVISIESVIICMWLINETEKPSGNWTATEDKNHLQTEKIHIPL